MPELHLANRVKELTTTEGTGAVSLGGALDGHQSFADSPITDGQTVAYLIRHRTLASEWEVGYGTFDATAGTLSRDTVLESPTNAKINFSSGDKIVFVGVAAEEVLLEGTAESISAVWDFAGGLNVGGVQLADASGEIPDARLSANVALLGAVQTFTAAQTFDPGPVIIGTDPGGTDLLRVGGGAHLSGNVGIGTSSPTEALDILGTVQVSDDILFAGTGFRSRVEAIAMMAVEDLEDELIEVTAGFGSARRLGVNTDAYSITNDVADRTFDANATTTAELADVLATLIRDLGRDS